MFYYESMENEPWFAAKSVFYDSGNNLYEERIVLHHAKDFNDAFKKSDKEVEEYVKSQNDNGSKIEFVKTVEIFHIFDERLEDGTELFSSLRHTTSDQKTYINDVYMSGLNWRDNTPWI